MSHRMSRRAKDHRVRSRRGFAIIELPLVLCVLIALAGVVAGAVLGYQRGSMAAGVLVRFSLVLPLLALVTLVSLWSWRERGRSE